jgi:hypothetical protein
MTLLSTLLLASLPVLAQGADTDRIALSFELDDASLQRLSAPALRLDVGGGDLVPMVDDGSLEGDQPGDHVWHAQARVRRAQGLDFTVLDTATGQSMGAVSVLLPAAGAADIRLRSTAGAPAVVLDDGSANSSPEAAAPPTSPTPAATAGSGDRFTYLLWVVLLLGLLGFGYMRVVVRRIYTQDFLPTWRKLDRWLDRQLEREP